MKTLVHDAELGPLWPQQSLCERGMRCCSGSQTSECVREFDFEEISSSFIKEQVLQTDGAAHTCARMLHDSMWCSQQLLALRHDRSLLDVSMQSNAQAPLASPLLASCSKILQSARLWRSDTSERCGSREWGHLAIAVLALAVIGATSTQAGHVSASLALKPEQQSQHIHAGLTTQRPQNLQKQQAAPIPPAQCAYQHGVQSST